MNTVRLEKREGMAVVTLDRPHVRNALSLEMVDELHLVLDACRQDSQVKVLVITGSGSSFISGGDLEQFIAVRGKEQSLPLLTKAGELLTAIDAMTKPTIAMINGAALGGGCEFAAACHFRFASENAVFGFVQIGMHITTGWGGGTRLLDKLPESRALALLLTGERFDAKQAEQIGFIDGLYQPECLQEEVYRFAGKIAAQPLEGIQAYMRMLQWKRAGMSQAERIRREIEQCADLWGSDEHVRVVQRFLRKG
ncbi:enoyl-CoA hydratase/isomerase family protein [Brevibacillus sp. H7]|uniref:enoyl-CoA hydratase/isomerase family protein n=1 Tax=Brevibacillus sp. H7 TaxID=3349138 RepID=UPI003826B577